MPTINFPDGTSANVGVEFLKLSAEEQSKTADEIHAHAAKVAYDRSNQAAIEGIGQGATLGTTDEMEGALRAAAAKAGGSDQSFSELYNQNVELPRSRYAGYEQTDPGAFVGGQMLGGLAIPVGGEIRAATAGGRALRGAATGGLVAGGYGFGQSEGGVGNRLEGAAVSAPVGAVIGAPLAAMHRPVLPTGTPPVGADAAAAAERADIPMISGVAGGPGAQTTTQALRPLPLVGKYVEGKVGATSEGIQSALDKTASDIAGVGGVGSRQIIGEQARGNLGVAVQNINERADNAYNTLRGAISPNAPVPIPPSVTDAADRVLASRAAAGNPDNTKGFENVINLIEQGSATFNGLQRARTDIGLMIKWDRTQGGGFMQGDLKIINDGLTQAMENAVRATAKGNPDDAVRLLNKANKTFGAVIDETGQISKVIARGSDESIATKLLSYATDKGDINKLRLLTNNMGYSERRQISAFALSRMGQNSKGDFSPAIFLTNWGKMTDASKELMFGVRSTATREAIEDIATVTRKFNEFESQRNFSGTAKHGLTYGLLGAAGAGAVYAYEDPMGAAKRAFEIGGVALPVAVVLTRPASAKSMARWASAYRSAIQRPANATLATFRVASRNFALTLAHQFGLGNDVDGIAGALTGTVETNQSQSNVH